MSDLRLLAQFDEVDLSRIAGLDSAKNFVFSKTVDNVADIRNNRYTVTAPIIYSSSSNPINEGVRVRVRKTNSTKWAYKYFPLKVNNTNREEIVKLANGTPTVSLRLQSTGATFSSYNLAADNASMTPYQVYLQGGSLDDNSLDTNKRFILVAPVNTADGSVNIVFSKSSTGPYYSTVSLLNNEPFYIKFQYATATVSTSSVVYPFNVTLYDEFKLLSDIEYDPSTYTRNSVDLLILANKYVAPAVPSINVTNMVINNSNGNDIFYEGIMKSDGTLDTTTYPQNFVLSGYSISNGTPSDFEWTVHIEETVAYNMIVVDPNNVYPGATTYPNAANTVSHRLVSSVTTPLPISFKSFINNRSFDSETNTFSYSFYTSGYNITVPANTVRANDTNVNKYAFSVPVLVIIRNKTNGSVTAKRINVNVVDYTLTNEVSYFPTYPQPYLVNQGRNLIASQKAVIYSKLEENFSSLSNMYKENLLGICLLRDGTNNTMLDTRYLSYFEIAYNTTGVPSNNIPADRNFAVSCETDGKFLVDFLALDTSQIRTNMYTGLLSANANNITVNGRNQTRMYNASASSPTATGLVLSSKNPSITAYPDETRTTKYTQVSTSKKFHFYLNSQAGYGFVPVCEFTEAGYNDTTSKLFKGSIIYRELLAANSTAPARVFTDEVWVVNTRYTPNLSAPLVIDYRDATNNTQTAAWTPFKGSTFYIEPRLSGLSGLNLAPGDYIESYEMTASNSTITEYKALNGSYVTGNGSGSGITVGLKVTTNSNVDSIDVTFSIKTFYKKTIIITSRNIPLATVVDNYTVSVFSVEFPNIFSEDQSVAVADPTIQYGMYSPSLVHSNTNDSLTTILASYRDTNATILAGIPFFRKNLKGSIGLKEYTTLQETGPESFVISFTPHTPTTVQSIIFDQADCSLISFNSNVSYIDIPFEVVNVVPAAGTYLDSVDSYNNHSIKMTVRKASNNTLVNEFIITWVMKKQEFMVETITDLKHDYMLINSVYEATNKTIDVGDGKHHEDFAPISYRILSKNAMLDNDGWYNDKFLIKTESTRFNTRTYTDNATTGNNKLFPIVMLNPEAKLNFVSIDVTSISFRFLDTEGAVTNADQNDTFYYDNTASYKFPPGQTTNNFNTTIGNIIKGVGSFNDIDRASSDFRIQIALNEITGFKEWFDGAYRSYSLLNNAPELDNIRITFNGTITLRGNYYKMSIPIPNFHFVYKPLAIGSSSYIPDFNVFKSDVSPTGTAYAGQLTDKDGSACYINYRNVIIPGYSTRKSTTQYTGFSAGTTHTLTAMEVTDNVLEWFPDDVIVINGFEWTLGYVDGSTNKFVAVDSGLNQNNIPAALVPKAYNTGTQNIIGLSFTSCHPILQYKNWGTEFAANGKRIPLATGVKSPKYVQSDGELNTSASFTNTFKLVRSDTSMNKMIVQFPTLAELNVLKSQIPSSSVNRIQYTLHAYLIWNNASNKGHIKYYHHTKIKILSSPIV